MHDNDLDAFPQEGETTAARVEATETRVIVITNDEIRSSWDAFPTEEADSQPTNDPIASATYTPPSRLQKPTARTATSRLRPFASAALVVAFGIGLFAGQAIVKRLVAPRQPQREVAARTPALTAPTASAESPKIGAVVVKSADVERGNEVVGAGRAPAKVVNTDRGARPPQRPTRPEPKARITAVAAPIARPAVPTRAAVAEPPPVARPVAASAAPAPPVSSIAATPAAAPPPVIAAVSPTAPTPAPAAAAVAAPAAVVAPPVAVAPAPDTRAVLGTLHRYQEAFSTLDSNAAQQVWPDVNVRALDRAFDQLAQQTFDLRACDVGVAGEHAEAMCTGTASYARKVGNKAMRVESRQWRFTLRRNSGDWLIEHVDVR